MAKEILDIVDDNGQPTGEVIDRVTAHREGILHRTSHVWLVRIKDGRQQVLLQKRSEEKDSYPGCYDISSAGHIIAGSDFETSALRELKEELDVDVEVIQYLCSIDDQRENFILHVHAFLCQKKKGHLYYRCMMR